MPVAPCRAAPPGLAAAAETLLPATIDLGELAAASRRIRRRAVKMVGIAGLGYLGQATSSAELFAVLYRSVLRHGRDRFVLSPGHYAISHYAAAVEAGLLREEALATYGADGSWLESISTERTPLVSATCGALGQGLSVAAGLALADVLEGRSAEDRRTFVLCSDGEMEEGQTWEAAMFAAHHGLAALVAVVDANGSQVDGQVDTVTTIEPLPDKWRAFGWDAYEVDGHAVAAVLDAFKGACGDKPGSGGSGRGSERGSRRPAVILARTRMLHGLPSLRQRDDAHFVTLGDGDLERALADTAEQA